MSASREKKMRQEQALIKEAPAAEPKKGMSKGLKTALGVLAAVILVAVVVFFAMVNGSYFQTHGTAIVANGHNLTPAMTNYYYTNAYSSMTDLLGYMADTEQPLGEQECSLTEGGTWSDYLMDYAANNAAHTYSIYDEAIANGFTLSEDSKNAIDTELTMLKNMAPMYGFSSGDALLAAQYGRGCNTKNYEEFLTVNYIVQEYSTSIYTSFNYTDSELDAHYAENAANFDGYTYRAYNLHVDAEGEGEEATVNPEALAAAEETAKAMAEAANGNEQAFIDQVAENAHEHEAETYADEAATLSKDYTASRIPAAIREWVTDEARVEGDTTYVANGSDNGFYVVYFIRQEDHSYQLPNVRHILISASESDDEAAKAEAKAKAEALLNEFLAGEATEDAFAALATENSADTASAVNGGLIEDIGPGTMVAAFDAWCFDEARQVGDTDIVETEYGYHVMYFSGFGTTYSRYQAKNAMLNADYTAWQTEVDADISYEVVSDRYVETR